MSIGIKIKEFSQTQFAGRGHNICDPVPRVEGVIYGLNIQKQSRMGMLIIGTSAKSQKALLNGKYFVVRAECSFEVLTDENVFEDPTHPVSKNILAYMLMATFEQLRVYERREAKAAEYLEILDPYLVEFASIQSFEGLVQTALMMPPN